MKPIVVMLLEMSLALNQKRPAPSCALVPGLATKLDDLTSIAMDYSTEAIDAASIWWYLPVRPDRV
jgi:hypothetical protein